MMDVADAFGFPFSILLGGQVEANGIMEKQYEAAKTHCDHSMVTASSYCIRRREDSSQWRRYTPMH